MDFRYFSVVPAAAWTSAFPRATIQVNRRKGERSNGIPRKRSGEAVAGRIWKGFRYQLKKMFGCLCVYCGGQPVGWLHGRVFSLREVGLSSLPGDLRRPQPGGPIQEIPIPLERAGEGWLAQAVKETAQRRREEKASP